MTNNILSTELFMCGCGLSLQIHRTKGWEAAGTCGMYPLFLVPTSWSSLHHVSYIIVVENHIDRKRIRIVLDLFFKYILLTAHCPSQSHYIFNLSLVSFSIYWLHSPTKLKSPTLHAEIMLPNAKLSERIQGEEIRLICFLSDRIPGAWAVHFKCCSLLPQ
jgi:hypothetical protein